MFETLNHFEAGLWIVIGLFFAVVGSRVSRPTNRRCCLLAVVFIAFGVSDVVEARTGAWWRPWWLLAWKAACVGVLLWQLRAYVTARRNTERRCQGAGKSYQGTAGEKRPS